MAKEEDLSPPLTVLGNTSSSLDAVDLPIVLIARDCKITGINRAASTVLGLTAADVGSSIGNPLARVKDLDRICARVISDGAPHRIEIRDGDRYFLVRIAPFSGNDRQISGAALAFTNVTAFRASIDQAIYEREYTKAILNAVIDPLVVLDAKLQVQTANRAFYALFGLSRNETHGVSIRKLGNSDWQTSEAWNSIEATLSGDAQFHAVEIDCELPSIGSRTIVLNARRLTRDGNELLLLTLQDVTERQQADRATSLLAAIVGFSEDAIISKNVDGIITSWNAGAERLFGYTASEAIGQHIALLIPVDRRAEEARILDRIRRGLRVEHFDTVRVRKDGTFVDISVTISPVRDASGKIVGGSKIARDITERKRIQQALRESEERYRTLADALDTQVQFRTRELEQRNVEVIEQAEQLRSLSNRLLQLQDDERRRIARELHDSSGQSLVALSMTLGQIARAAKNSPGQLAKSIDQAEELVRHLTQEIRTTSYLLHPPMLDESGLSLALRVYIQGLAERGGLQIDLEMADDFERPSLEIELVIFRLVQECLTNIHRHSGSASALIRVEREQRNIRVSVQDKGKGISREKLAGIDSKGMGVGIRGMRERVRHFHGELLIESTGTGTKVTAIIPVETRSATDDDSVQHHDRRSISA